MQIDDGSGLRDCTVYVICTYHRVTQTNAEVKIFRTKTHCLQVYTVVAGVPNCCSWTQVSQVYAGTTGVPSCYR